MKKEAVLHVPLSQFAYAYDERTIVLRLRAAKGDLKSCKVFYGDRAQLHGAFRCRGHAPDRFYEPDCI